MREYSLRRHVWRVVALVAVAPLLLTTLGVPLDHWMRSQMSARTASAAEACLPLAVAGDSCAAVASKFEVWIRVVDDGETVQDFDEGTRKAVGWIEQLMDPESRFWLIENDPFQGTTTRPDGCDSESLNRLLTCTATRTSADGSTRVLAVAGDVRSVRALSSDGVTKLVLEVLLVALFVGWWLGRRIIDPIETLRNRVVERVGAGAPEPIDSDDPTEVGELADAFNSLVADLDSRRKANQEFAADLAHELKNPVATVLSCAENLDDGGALDEQQAQRYARVLKRSGEQLNGLIQDFLDLARAEAGLERVDREDVALDELVGAVIERFRSDPVFEGRTIEARADAVVVHGSSRHLELVVSNLLANALQVGGDVVVELLRDGDDVLLRVSDDGPGIAADQLSSVFDRFYSRREGGTGLGLAMARAIVRAHGGAVSVRSTVGQGTTFEVVLRADGGQSHDSHIEMTNE